MLFSGLGSTTTLASSQNPSLTGGAVTLIATVTGPGGTPTGTVVFMDGTNTLGIGTLNASGVASFSTAALITGPHSVTAVYGGNSTFAGSASSILSQTVSGPNTITINNPGFEANYNVPGNGGGYPGSSYAAPPNSWSGYTVNGGSPFYNTYGAWVPATQSGYLSGYVGNNVAVIGNSTSSSRTEILYQDIGSISQSGNYQLSLLVGNDKYGGSGNNPTIVVATGASGSTPGSGFTALTATSSNTPALTSGNWGTMVTWTLNYTIPTGTHVFIELENNNFSSGGSGNICSVDYDNLSLVGGTPTTTALTSSPNPSSSSVSVTFTATVTGTGSSFPTTGTVTFYDNGTTNLGTGTVNSSGVATLASSALSAGTHSITAAYGGGGSYGGSISGTVTQTITAIGPANAYKITANTTTPAAGANDTITITQVDSSGNTETGYNGTTNLTFSGLSAGPDSSLATVNGTSLGTATSITFSSGVATAALVAHKAETATLNATDGTRSTTSTGGAGVSLTVSGGTPTKLAYTSAPSTGTAGTAFSVTVQSQDTYGNAANLASATTITLSKATGGGALSGTLTGSIGIGANSVTIATPVYSKSDTMTLTATASGGVSLTAVTSGNITFSAGVATHLVYTTVPGTGTAGTAFSVTVQSQDANGNPSSPTSNSTISLSKATGGGALSGTLTGAILTSGNSVTITTPVYSKSDTLTLTATATAGMTGLTAVTSGNIVFSAGTATQLVYTTVPGTGTAGTAFSVTVQSQDANGNPANPTSSTTITLSKATGGGTLSGTLTGSIGTGANSVTISTPVYSKSDTLTLTATATAGMTSLTAVTSGNIVFSAGTATQTQVETAADGSGTVSGTANVTAGTSITVYAITRDANGNFVGNPSATWSLQSVTGGVVSGDLSTTTGASTTFSGHVIGSAILQAVAGGFRSIRGEDRRGGCGDADARGNGGQRQRFRGGSAKRYFRRFHYGVCHHARRQCEFCGQSIGELDVD
jgi:hypothetical protein